MSIKKAKLLQDKTYPSMWRVKWPDGEVSDMVNKTRAKDAIRCFEEYDRRHNINSLANGARRLTDALF